MAQINRHEFPAGGGWIFRQPQFGPQWKNEMAMVGFNASVNYIRKARLANPAITAKHSLATDPEAIGNELEAYTRLRLGIPEPSFFDQRSSLLSDSEVAAASVSWLKEIKHIGAGARTLADWLGSGGKPVEAELSNQRAAICAVCPQNRPGNLLAFFTKPVSNLIQRQLEERKSMNLSTPHDEKLGVCAACSCPLKLKVHVPLLEIKKHMTADVAANLDGQCWILHEPFA